MSRNISRKSTKGPKATARGGDRSPGRGKAAANTGARATAKPGRPSIQRSDTARVEQAADAGAAGFTRPEILAPAGDMQAALAGLAAGADALYLGLKHFSARMQAENFSTADLAALTELAHKDGRRIYVAMNTLVKPSGPPQAYRLIRRLAAGACPDALIVQDPCLLDVARQAGFEGQLHLSTLANVTHQKALLAAREAGADRVIVPREL